MYTNYAKTVSTLSQTAKITCVVFNMDHGNWRKKCQSVKEKTNKKKCEKVMFMIFLLEC